MKFMESLKKRNRTVLEMELGIFFYGLFWQIVSAFMINRQQIRCSISLWLGIGLAVAAVHHMQYTLERALDFDEGQAQKLLLRGFAIRYMTLMIIVMAIIYTKVLNPLIVFLAYMGLKVAAYLQPFTHKLCNKIFHETDPCPEPLLEEQE